MAARKKCGKCGAGNDGAALTCSLCGQKLPPLVKTTMEAFELEPRQWTGNSQRRRGAGPDEPAAAAPSDEAGAAVARATPVPPPAVEAPPVTGSGHFLLPPVGPPLRLEGSVTSYVFGRDEACSVRVASAKVSRRHAEVRWRGNPAVLVLRDLNSQNGTYLNDKKMAEEVALCDGDTIRMGDYIASYRFVPEGEDVADLQRGGETAIMGTVAASPDAKLDEGGALTGDAAILPINEILKRLMALHAGGVLAVDVGGTKGQMKLVDGRAVDGVYAGLEGTHAIQAMASLSKGRFRFDADPDAPMARPTPTGRLERTASSDGHPAAAPNPAPAPRPAAAPAHGAGPRTPGPGSAPAQRPGGPPPPRPGGPPPGHPGAGSGPAARPGGPPPGPRPAPRPPAPPI